MTHAVPTIYIVDDDSAVRDSLRALLEAFGMDVRDYGSAKAFLADPYGNKRGCLILDLHMPEMSGIELLEVLREKDSSLPVIMFTGRGDINLREHAERSGAIALLAKPVDTELLLQTIQRVASAP
jgi:two-component system response regulator FixJ